MPWPEAQIDELIDNVRRDFALGRVNPKFWVKLKSRGISLKRAEKVVSKNSYIIEYDHNGRTIGFFDSKNDLFVAWKPNYPSEIKTCFIAEGGLGYLKRQHIVHFIWTPR